METDAGPSLYRADMSPRRPRGEAPGPDRPPLTPAQRRAVAAADPDTGEIRASAPTLGRLAALGLARPYGRLGAHYLTPEGRTVCDELRGPVETSDPTQPPAPGFSPATGDDQPSTEADRAPAAQAWRSLLEIRRLEGAGRTGDPADAAAAWERARPRHAVALALEASGTPPSAVDGSGRRARTGYRVTADGTEPGTVRVEWRSAAGPDTATPAAGGRDRLDACARVLSARGWATERYTDSRRRPFLVVVPRTES